MNRWREVFCCAATSAFTLFLSIASAQSQTANFVRTYVESFGGCGTPQSLLIFEKGSNRARALYGKPTEQWTDSDLQLLKAAMSECVPNPNGFDRSQERDIYMRVARAVKVAQSRQQAQEAAVNARRELEEAKRRRDQEQTEANQRAEATRQSDALKAQRAAQDAALERNAGDELQSFTRHVMTATEVERAQQIAQELPSLAGRVAELLAAQTELKRRADLEVQQQRERQETARRLEAEQRKQALAEQRAAEDARIAAEKKADAFETTLPASCKEAEAGEKRLGDKAMSDKLVKAEALGEAGEASAACSAMNEVVALMEKTRVAFVQCTRDLEDDTGMLAQERSALDLSKAIDLHTRQHGILEVMREMPCH